MTRFEFENSLNWNLVTRLDLQAAKIHSNPNIYDRIPAKSIAVSKRILMIGCRSTTAKPTWWLGCRASKRLLISPSSTSQFPSAVYTEQRSCPLNALRLIKFDFDGLYPYLLVLEPPPWLNQLYIEIWAYDGADDLSSTS